jgi:hypothetical protein
MEGVLRLSFAGGAQAARANLDAASLTILKNGHSLHIRLPLPLGVAQRVANIMPGHWFFLADFTFGHGNFLYLDYQNRLALGQSR